MIFSAKGGHIGGSLSSVDILTSLFFHVMRYDPATGDSDYGHSDNQMERAVAQANNGVGGVGVCPGCMLLPIKAGHEAFDTTDRVAQSVMFATDSGADVLTLLDAELGYSDFTKQALQYAWNKGVVVTGASNDFDSSDHQNGMFWPHLWPGNGLQPNDISSGTADLSKYVTTFRNRSNETSFGPHALFSTPNSGGSTSESTPTQAGVALLKAVVAQGLDARADELAVQVDLEVACACDPCVRDVCREGQEADVGGRVEARLPLLVLDGGDVDPVVITLRRGCLIKHA